MQSTVNYFAVASAEVAFIVEWKEREQHFLINKNEEQAEPENSLVPVPLSPLLFSFPSHVPSTNLMFSYLLHSTSGLYQRLHFSPSIILVHCCALHPAVALEGMQTWILLISLPCKSGLHVFTPTLNPSISFSFAYPYWLHLAAHTHFPSSCNHCSPASCFLIGIPKLRLSQQRSMCQAVSNTQKI